MVVVGVSVGSRLRSQRNVPVGTVIRVSELEVPAT